MLRIARIELVVFNAPCSIYDRDGNRGRVGFGAEGARIVGLKPGRMISNRDNRQFILANAHCLRVVGAIYIYYYSPSSTTKLGNTTQRIVMW